MAELHVRLPADLKAAIQAEAEWLGLSVNATVVLLLRNALEEK